MISSLGVRRFRSIHQEDINLELLTVIVGPNGVGKSNLIYALTSGIKAAAALISRLEDAAAIDEPPMPIVDDAEIYGYLRTKDPKVSIEIGLSSVLGKALRSHPLGTISLTQRPKTEPQSLGYELTATKRLAKALADVTFVSTDRLVPNFARGVADTALSNPSLRDALDVISRDPVKRSKLLQIGHDLFNLDWAGLFDDQGPHFRDQAIGPSGVSVPFKLASLGTQQFFPIVVYTLAANKGGVVVTEEPEISLHPKAQVEIGEYFALRAAAGVQVVVTTHSHYLLQGVCKQVREGSLQPEHVAILNCTKGNYGTKVKRLPIDSDGRIDGWIPSFVAVDDYLFNDWIASLPEVVQ